MKIFSVFDVKSGTFYPPFSMDNEANAIRAFVDLSVSPDSIISRYPADFYLVYLRDFDPISGVFSFNRPNCPVDVPVRLMSAEDAQRSCRRGGAVGGTGPVPPEDSEASAERSNLTDVPDIPGLVPESPADQK